MRGVLFFIVPTLRRGNAVTDAPASVGVVSLSRRMVFEVGSRTDCRNTFFCLAKRKYPKKRPPGFRQFPALLAFGEGFRRAILGPAKTSGILAAPQMDLLRQKLRCLGRNNGSNPVAGLKVVRYILTLDMDKFVGCCRRQEAHRSRSMCFTSSRVGPISKA